MLWCFPESLSGLLWNLHRYYSQFSDCVQARISQLRQPIEKELKVLLGVSASTVSSQLRPEASLTSPVVLRISSRSPGGMMSVSGPSSSRWRRPIGESAGPLLVRTEEPGCGPDADLALSPLFSGPSLSF